MTPRKVIQLTPYYPPHVGGVERVAEALATGLARNHDVEVWTTGVGGHTDAAGPEATFPVRRLPALEIAHTPVAVRLPRLLLGLPPESVVHVHVAQALWPEVAAWAASRRGFRMVAHFHLDVDPTGPGGLLLPLYKRHCLTRSLQRADAVIALTHVQAEFLEAEYAIDPKRLHVMANGVDPSYLAAGGVTRSPGQPLRALFVGRLDRQKNIPRLLGALARVTEPVDVVLVGDGEQKAECESLRDRLGLHRVRFVGVQHGPDLLRWYRWADIFVLPSDREGMPLALLEAMAAGLAIVATDVSEVAGQVANAGLVVPPDTGHLVGAITALARHGQLLDDLKRRSRIRGRSFSWDSAVTQLSDLYESLAA